MANELYILYKDGTKDWVCPIEDFKEDAETLICDNGYSTYKFNKESIKYWEIDECNCREVK